MTSDPFGPYLWWDVLRTVTSVLGLLFAMLCAKVAYIMARRDEPDWGDSAGWASHALLALTATGLMADRIGGPPKPWLVLTLMLALALGVLSLLKRLRLPKWLFGGEVGEAQKEKLAAENRAARAALDVEAAEKAVQRGLDDKGEHANGQAKRVPASEAKRRPAPAKTQAPARAAKRTAKG